MSEMEEKLSAVLSNPQMMQQILSMAQALGAAQLPQKQEAPPPAKNDPEPSTLPNLDPRMLQSLSRITRQGAVDQNQQALLKALSPFLSRNRITKLERAMRASKMAGAASAFLNAGGLQLLSGR